MTSHLDDEALSSVLDGEASDSAAAHARSCERCATRLEELAGAARAVGVAPPAPPPDRREAILAAALAAAPAPEPVPDAVSPVGGAPDHRRPSPPSRRPASWRPWMAAAAAVAALAVAVPVVSSRLGADLDQTVAAGKGPRAADEAPTGEAAAPPVAFSEGGGIDLDALRDDPPTIDQLAARLSGQQRAGPEAAPAPERLTAGRPDEPAADAAAGVASTCEASVRRRHPDLGELAYAADAVADGVPVEMLAFAAPPGPGDDGATPQLIVAGRGSCTELAVVPLPG